MSFYEKYSKYKKKYLAAHGGGDVYRYFSLPVIIAFKEINGAYKHDKEGDIKNFVHEKKNGKQYYYVYHGSKKLYLKTCYRKSGEVKFMLTDTENYIDDISYLIRSPLRREIVIGIVVFDSEKDMCSEIENKLKVIENAKIIIMEEDKPKNCDILIPVIRLGKGAEPKTAFILSKLIDKAVNFNKNAIIIGYFYSRIGVTYLGEDYHKKCMKFVKQNNFEDTDHTFADGFLFKFLSKNLDDKFPSKEECEKHNNQQYDELIRLIQKKIEQL